MTERLSRVLKEKEALDMSFTIEIYGAVVRGDRCFDVGCYNPHRLYGR